MEFAIQPFECRAYVIHLAFSIVMAPLAQSGAAKIKAQHRKSKTVQSFHNMKYDFIVKGPSENRMRMADKSRMGSAFSSPIQ
jgi:hypothetical protein